MGKIKIVVFVGVVVNDGTEQRGIVSNCYFKSYNGPKAAGVVEKLLPAPTSLRCMVTSKPLRQ